MRIILRLRPLSQFTPNFEYHNKIQEESHNLSEKQNVMDDITHGQWSKNHYNNDDNDYDDRNSILNDEILILILRKSLSEK